MTEKYRASKSKGWRLLKLPCQKREARGARDVHYAAREPCRCGDGVIQRPIKAASYDLER